MELLDLPITSVHTSSSHTKKNPSVHVQQRQSSKLYGIYIRVFRL